VTRHPGPAVAPKEKLILHQQVSRVKIANSEVVTISGLRRATGLDRETIRRRLNAAKLEPKSSKPTEKLYDLEAAKIALGKRNAHESAGLTDARRRKVTAETARIVIALQRERGELIAISEVREHLFRLIRAMYERISRTYPRQNARRLIKCHSAADLARTLEIDISRIFDELKHDHPQLF